MGEELTIARARARRLISTGSGYRPDPDHINSDPEDLQDGSTETDVSGAPGGLSGPLHSVED